MSREHALAGGGHRWVTPLIAAGSVAYAWVLAGFGSFTLGSALGVGVVGVVGVLTAASEWPADRSAPVPGPVWDGAWGWIALIVAVGVWELVAFLLGGVAHPTISDLMDPPLSHQGLRAVVIIGWLAAGWRLVRL